MSKEVLLVVESVSNEKGVPASVILKRWSWLWPLLPKSVSRTKSICVWKSIATPVLTRLSVAGR